MEDVLVYKVTILEKVKKLILIFKMSYIAGYHMCGILIITVSGYCEIIVIVRHISHPEVPKPNAHESEQFETKQSILNMCV